MKGSDRSARTVVRQSGCSAPVGVRLKNRVDVCCRQRCCAIACTFAASLAMMSTTPGQYEEMLLNVGKKLHDESASFMEHSYHLSSKSLDQG
jgi:hypothetical protein